MKQRFHLPDMDGLFSACDDDTCTSDHQTIAVKSVARQFVLVDDHGSHTWIQHALEPMDLDPRTTLRSQMLLAHGIDCTDCEFDEYTPQEWARENARLMREQLTLKDRVKPTRTSH